MVRGAGSMLTSEEKATQKRYRDTHQRMMYLTRTRSQLKQRYGITIEQRDEMLAEQGGCCKLCGRDDCHWGKGFQNVWHIDHVHGTRIVRGILCAACNMLVGQIEKNLTLSLEAIKYLAQQ
jgi:hypothetical protein